MLILAEAQKSVRRPQIFSERESLILSPRVHDPVGQHQGWRSLACC